MRLFVIALISLVVVGEFCQAAIPSHDHSEWITYKLKHGKSYASQAEEARRMANFFATKQEVERHNSKGDSSFKMELNHFADWTQEELAMMNGLKVDESTFIKAQENLHENEAYLAKILSSSSDPIPDEFDWRKVPGRVSHVKNQGHCGSCWAFSAVGTLEGQEIEHAFNKTNKFVALSDQEVVDCSMSNGGCDGGNPESVFDDLKKIGGIMSENDYPYKAQRGKCAFNETKAVMTDAGYVILPWRDETTLKEVLAKFGPIAAGLHATDNLIHYKSGVFTDKTCSRAIINHGVLLVGYGSDSDVGDYWIVKNSWGAKWGEEGYFRIKRGVDMCGIGFISSIPKF